jgi:hypothetical protein
MTQTGSRPRLLSVGNVFLVSKDVDAIRVRCIREVKRKHGTSHGIVEDVELEGHFQIVLI